MAARSNRFAAGSGCERLDASSRLAQGHFLSLILCVFAFIISPLTSYAQTTRPARGSELTVYLMTMGPGDLIWEKFGHNAIVIMDRRDGSEIAYNYGLFDFDEEDFFKRFILGQMRYWMDGFSFKGTLDSYVKMNRSVWMQELNLSPQQRAALQDFLEWNRLPSNRYYTYDYYRDNCSTRVRDAIDKVVGGAIAAQLQPKPAGVTYRWHTRQIMADSPPLYTALEYILGQPVDQPLSAWQQSYLPIEFMKHIERVTITDANHQQVPLVRSTRELFSAQRAPLRDDAPVWVWGHLTAGAVIAGGILLLTSGRRFPRWMGAAVFILWSFLLGGAGLFLAWGWMFTDHVAIRANENILLFNPVAFVVFLLVLAVLAGKRRYSIAFRWTVWAVLATSLLLLVLKVLPQFDQSNWTIIALALPPNAAMAWVAHRLAARASAAEVQPAAQAAPAAPSRKKRISR